VNAASLLTREALLKPSQLKVRLPCPNLGEAPSLTWSRDDHTLSRVRPPSPMVGEAIVVVGEVTLRRFGQA